MIVAVNTLFLIPGEVGGSETYLREILLAVAREHLDIQLALVTNQENDATLRKIYSGFPQCSFHCLPVRATNRYARILAEQVRLPSIVRRIRPDLLWSPGYTMPFWAPCPQVVSILDMQYRSHPDDLARLARWTTHLLVMLASRRADGILAISHFSKQEIVRHTKCSPDRISVTHLGVESAFRAPIQQVDHPLTSAQPEARSLQPCILSVANSYPHKNLACLAEAFALIMDQIPQQLVLVGRPRLGEPALLHALEKIPPDRVNRMAGLSQQELIALYQSADIFVFPSLYEGFGLPVLEAMMTGVPVITTCEGSIPEVGGDEVVYADGCDPADMAAKIREVIHWPEEVRRKRVEAASARAAAFTWSAAAESTITAWRKAL